VGRDPGRSVGDVQCRIVGPEELTTADLAAWSDCAAASLEPNPFLEPAWLLPAIEHLDESPTARLAIVEHDGAIHALAPVEQIAAGHDATGAPRGHSALVTRVTPTAVALGTPLVTHQGGADAARSLLAGLRREAARVGASHVILEWIGADGPIAPLLQGVLAHADHPLFQFDSWERAMLRRRPGDDAGYSLRNVGKNRLRTIRQHRRHLDEALGASPGVRTRTDLGAIDAFLRLEASGWKGHEADGLALRQRDGAKAFFETACRQFLVEGRLWFHSLECDGEPIAMICMVRADEGEFAFRTAYDEDLAKFGPGVEVFVDAMQQFERSTDGAGSTRAPHRATGTSWGCSPTVTS
jgi:CelD/BcsL family acetyltransferase involved in cellulose biosynthesis